MRKLGVPFQPEYGFGAIGEGGVRVIDDCVVRQTRLTGPQIAEVEARERVLLNRRVSQLRVDHRPVPLAERTVITVDHGIAPGSTARAACQVARRGARRVILAVPVGSVEGTAALRGDADEVVCLHTPARFCRSRRRPRLASGPRQSRPLRRPLRKKANCVPSGAAYGSRSHWLEPFRARWAHGRFRCLRRLAP